MTQPEKIVSGRMFDASKLEVFCHFMGKPKFIDALENKNLIHLAREQHGNKRLSISQQDVAKIIIIVYELKHRKAEDKRDWIQWPDSSKLRGIISQEYLDGMEAEPWWKEFSEKVNGEFSMTPRDIMKPFVTAIGQSG